MNNNISDRLYRQISPSLLGEIYPEIRAIAAAIINAKKLFITYYINRAVPDDDWKSIEVVAVGA